MIRRRIAWALLLLLGGASSSYATCGYSDVAMAYAEACAIDATDGTVDCWGAGSDGEDTPPGGAFLDICGDAFTLCGVKSDGSLACWGDNTYSQTSTEPAGTSWTKVACGFGASCALKNDGSVDCWGTYAPTDPAGTFAKIDGTDEGFCGVKTNGSLLCWGSDTYDVVTDTPAGTDWAEVRTWSRHACGRKNDGTVTCWGSNTYGQATAPGGTFLSAAVSGFDDSCGVTSACEISCWGCTQNGTDDDCTDYVEPAGNTFASIVGSVNNYCALDTGGNITCWMEEGFDIVANVPVTACPTTPCGGAAAVKAHVCVVQ